MGDIKDIKLSLEQKEELAHILKTVDKRGNGFIRLTYLGDALNAVGIKIAPYEVRKMASELEKLSIKGIKNRWNPVGAGQIKNGTIPNKSIPHANGDIVNGVGEENTDAQITFNEFEKLYRDLKSKEFATSFKSMVSRKDNLVTHGGMSETSSEGTTHTVRQEEQVAFSHWINTNLGQDSDLKYLLPIDCEGKELYDKVKDGILFCKIINFSCPDTIDERAVNKKNLNLYTMHENLVLAINSALAIGCNVVNIGADDLSKGKPHLVLGLLWQIIRIGLFNQVDLHHCPGLIKLLGHDEKLEDMMKLSTEAILLRWVNYHLKNAGYDRVISNFSSDIVDSLAYIYLINEIAPKDKGVGIGALREHDLERRAELMLREADKIKCRAFVSPRDVVNGNPKLNVAFVANMFNTHPALLLPDDLADKVREIEQDEGIIEETREEKTYRNWMNSMGVSPYVNWLYSDLTDGLIILQLYDCIKPGIVEWAKVHKRFSKLKAFMEKIENCNYAIHLGKRMRFSLVGIGGQDINDGNHTLTLALVWQLMRAYTLSLLCNLTHNALGTGKEPKPITEKEIIVWVNTKLKSNNKSSKINSFQDSSISDAKVLIDLIDSIKNGCIDYTQVKDGISDEVKLANAKYAISMSRKLGAKIYALPDDIVEVKPKMVMTVFACLMVRDFNQILVDVVNYDIKAAKSSAPPLPTPSSTTFFPSPDFGINKNPVKIQNNYTSPSPVTVVGSPCSRTLSPQDYRSSLKSSPVKSPLNQHVIFSSSPVPSSCVSSPGKLDVKGKGTPEPEVPTIPTMNASDKASSIGSPDMDLKDEIGQDTTSPGESYSRKLYGTVNHGLINVEDVEEVLEEEDRINYLKYADHMNGGLSPDILHKTLNDKSSTNSLNRPSTQTPECHASKSDADKVSGDHLTSWIRKPTPDDASEDEDNLNTDDSNIIPNGPGGIDSAKYITGSTVDISDSDDQLLPEAHEQAENDEEDDEGKANTKHEPALPQKLKCLNENKFGGSVMNGVIKNKNIEAIKSPLPITSHKSNGEIHNNGH